MVIHPNLYFGAAIFRQLTTAQLQELCRRNGLSLLGRRKTLENRLKTAGMAPAATPNDQPVNRQLPSTGLPVQQRAVQHSRRSKSPKSSDWFKTSLQPQPETSPGRPLVQPQEFWSHRHRPLHR